MKFVTYLFDKQEKIGLMSPDLSQIWPLEQFGFSQPDMSCFIETVTDAELDRLRELSRAEICVPYAAAEKRAPIPRPRQDILCLGMNFAEHKAEAARYDRAAFERERGYAVYFSKRVNEAVPDGGAIPSHSDIVERLDYEAELAVILRRDASRVKPEEVEEHIFGYTIINDVSAREQQQRHKQFTFAKSMDGFTPMGPWIVTRDELDFPLNAKIRCHVNGELRQDSDMTQAIFSVTDVVTELTQGMTLKAATIIAMGTPAGVGMGFDPPKFLRPGDVVSCEIEGIGSLTNTVL